MYLSFTENLLLIYWYFFDWGKAYWYKYYIDMGMLPKYALEKADSLW